MGGFGERKPWELKHKERDCWGKRFFIEESEIQDRSKGDVISKLLVLTQVTWFILQFFARLVQHLPATEIEVVTLAYAILNMVTYACWWYKPLAVQFAPTIPERRLDYTSCPRCDPKPPPSTVQQTIVASQSYKSLHQTNSSNLDIHASGHSLVITSENYHPQMDRKSADGAVHSYITPPDHATPEVQSTVTTTPSYPSSGLLSGDVPPVDQSEHVPLHPTPSHNPPNSSPTTGGNTRWFSPGRWLKTTREVLISVRRYEMRDILGYKGTKTVIADILRLCDVDVNIGRKPDFIANVIAFGTAMVFGAIHLLAWRFQFLSHAERLLWLVPSMFVTCSPLYMLLVYCIFDTDLHRILRLNRIRVFGVTPRNLIDPVISVSSFLYFIGRVSLLVQMMVLLRAPEKGAYQTVYWTTFVPHLQ